LLLIAVLAFAVTLLALLPQAWGDDSWLALVTGRGIWNHGIPYHESLTVMALGHRWPDQQWLSQLASYGLYRVGGLGLLGLVNVALMVSAVGAGVIVARRRGARAWVVMTVLALCLMQIVPAREVRTQAFAMPLIVATIALLSGDSRRHTKRVYLCLPILVLWANLHGTAALGAGMVMLYGVVLAWERWRHPGPTGLRERWAAPILLTAGPLVCILLTPYGLGMFPYYESTLSNGTFKQLVTEWQPITSQMAIAIPFFLLAGLVIWSFGRRPESTTVWEKLVLVVLAAGSIMVIRNGLIFGFAALLIAPASLDAALPRRRADQPAPVRDRLNLLLCGAAASLLVIIAGATLIRPAGDFEYRQVSKGLLSVVRTETQRYPGMRIFADVQYADWLLWVDPSLRGRIAYDARFELLSAAQMEEIVRALSAIGPDWKRAAAGYRLVILRRGASPDAIRGLVGEPGRRVLYDRGGQVVLLRSPRSAG
jgi:hypothetical protein